MKLEKPVSELSVMKKHCKTCPFKPVDKFGTYQFPETASEVISSTLFNSQQVCHHNGYDKKKKQFRCKGSYDYNKMIYDRLGLGHLLK